jgi:hypothetical protein
MAYCDIITYKLFTKVTKIINTWTPGYTEAHFERIVPQTEKVPYQQSKLNRFFIKKTVKCNRQLNHITEYTVISVNK